jgi:hypothetical protein
MRLTESVMAGGRVMLAGGRELTPEDIATLKRRFPKLHVRVGDPVLDELVDFQDDSHDREVAYTVQQRVGEALAGVQEKFSPRTSLAAVNFSSVQMAVGEVLQYLKCNSVSALLLSRSVESDCYLAEHAGNVFYASMLLGAIIREYVAAERKRQSLVRDLRDDHVMDMTPLGLGAMFADIGMLPLKHLFALDDPLSDEDREAVIRHPLDGAAMLGEDFSPLGRMIVRTHHENCAGKGYPNAVTRDKLHIFTRIVRIADAFGGSRDLGNDRRPLPPLLRSLRHEGVRIAGAALPHRGAPAHGRRPLRRGHSLQPEAALRTLRGDRLRRPGAPSPGRPACRPLPRQRALRMAHHQVRR